jgi:multisubunit Na+/H+ antiporter MnhB subunit
MWTTFLLIFTVTASLVNVVALPVMAALAACRSWKKRSLFPLLRPLSIAGGLAIGIAVAWLLMIFHYGWPLSFLETFYATVHSELYGELENAAEDFVFFMLLLGNLGAILVGLSGWLLARSRRQVALAH